MQQYSIRFTFDGQDYFANFDSEFSALQIELVESGDFVAGNAALAGTALTALFHMRAVEHWGEDGNAEFFDKAFRADQTFRAAVTTAETNSWWSDAGEVAGGSLASAAGSVQAGAPVAAAISVIPGLGLPAAGVSLGLTATTSALAGGVTAALTVSARNADIAYNGMLGTFGGSLNADLINYFMEFVADIDVDPETGARRIGELRPITDTEITWSDFNTQSASAIANLYTVAAMAGEIERVEGNLPQTDLWQSYVDSFAASLITSKDPTGISGAVLGSARSVFDLHARDGRPESFEAFIASIESHIDSRVSEVTSELRGLLNNAGRRGFTYIGTDNDDRFVVGADSATIYTLGGRNEVLAPEGGSHTIIGGSGDLTVSLAVDALGGKNVVHGGDGHNALTLDISALDVGEMATAAWRPAIKPNTNWSASSLRVERLTPEDVTFAQARAFAEASTAEMHRERYLFLDTTLEGQSRLMRSGDVWSGQFDPVPDSAFHLRELDMLHYEGGAGDDLLIPFGNGVTRAIGGGGTNTLYVDWRDFAADVVWDLNATLEDETELANGWTVQGIHRLLGYMGDGDHDITFVGGGNHIVAGDGDYLIRSTHGGDRLELAASRNADIALRDLGNGNEITGGSGDLTVSLAVDALGGVNVVRGGDGHNALTLDISALDTGQMPDAAWRPLLISGTGRTPQRSRLDPETVTLSQAETFARGTVTTSRHMVEGERWLYLDDGTGAEGATGTQIRTFNLDTLNYIGGDGNDLMIGLGGDEFFRGGLGNDVVVLNGGSNRIIGTLEELHGDRILDLTTRDVIVVEGIELADHNVAFDTAETRLIITPEGSEIAFHIDLYGEFIPQAFEVTVVGEISEIRYLGEIAPDPILLPNLDLSAIQDGPVIEGRVFDIDTGFSVLSVNGMPVTEDSLYDGILGTLQISDDGVFSYNPDMAVHLPEDERQDDLFTLVVSNSVGDTSELVIRASVTGVNDPASISGDSTGLVIEDDADRQQASGVLTVIDPDAGEDRFADVDPAALAGDYGSFAFDPESGAWSYTLDNDLDAVQALPEGAEVTDSLSVSSLDGTATETITVTITGSGLRGDFAPATVSGSVHDRWGNPISDAALQFVPEAANLESSASAGDQEGPGVTLSGDVRMGIVHTGEATNQNGHFTFELDRGSSGDIDLIRGYDNDRDGGPGLRDALDVLRLSMGLSVSGRETEALDFIAADVNQDGVIDAQDSTAVLRAALGLETDHGSRWIFIDDAADLSGLDRNNSSVATGFRVDEINSDIADLAMTGILLGTMQENA